MNCSAGMSCRLWNTISKGIRKRLGGVYHATVFGSSPNGR